MHRTTGKAILRRWSGLISQLGATLSAPWFKAIVSALLLLGLTASILVFSKTVQHLSSIGYIGLFLVALVSSATFVIPGASLVGVLIGGAELNPWLVGLVMGVGSGIGEVPGFLFGVTNRSLFARVPGASLVARWMSRHARITIFLLAATPNYLYDVGSTMAGVSKMPPLHFVLATVAGKIIRFTMSALLASWISRVLGIG